MALLKYAGLAETIDGLINDAGARRCCKVAPGSWRHIGFGARRQDGLDAVVFYWGCDPRGGLELWVVLRGERKRARARYKTRVTVLLGLLIWFIGSPIILVGRGVVVPP